MKNKFLLNTSICFWLIVLIVTFVASCTASVKPQEQTEAAAKAPTVTMPIITIATEVNTLPAPTIESSPTKTPIPILTPIPALGVDQRATLEARERFVQELMKTNGNCQLPCWWGIELEQNIETVGQMFTDHDIPGWNLTASDISVDGLLGYINSGYYEFENFFFYVGISLKFYALDGKVQFIDVLAERPLRQYGEEELVRDWEKYAINSILQQYGIPPYVYLIPRNVADPSPPSFVLIMYYPDLGLNFSYQPQNAPFSETQAELCLALENMRQINLSLYSPEFVDTWPNYLLPPALNPEAEDYFKQLTWEAQTGMNLDAFYEIYKDSTSPECIQITR